MTQHIFLHIPKTAGSSIRTLLQQNYPAEATIGFSGDRQALAWWRGLPAEERAPKALVHGHFPYGMHAEGLDHTYFTFLRDPIDRHFSDYYFIKRYTPHPQHEALASGAVTLEDWASIFDTVPKYRDLSTRLVAGQGDRHIPDRMLLETAKYNLQVDFTLVGLAERFDESVLILARRLGWGAYFYLTKNVSTDREPLPDALRERASQNLRRDLELYDFARGMFEASPELHDPLFQDALAEFREVRGWLEQTVANDQSAFFTVGSDLPSLTDVVRAHRPTPALDRYFGRPESTTWLAPGSGTTRPDTAEGPATMKHTDLIFDIGMHTGLDTEWYLAKGFRVVAVEANPMLAAQARERFASEIAAGRLIVEQVGIAETEGVLPFYVNLDNDEWSSFSRALGTRDGTRFDVIEVPCITADTLFERYGIPYFVKIDIEGLDHLVLRALRSREEKPNFLSVEDNGFSSLIELYNAGGCRFKFVDQVEKWKIEPPNPPREGSYAPASFGACTSGPFGEEVPGDWMLLDEAAQFYLEHIRPPKVGLQRHWWDIHARCW